MKHETLRFHSYDFTYGPIKDAKKNLHKIIAVNLPEFKGMLSYFTQPGKMFADDFAERLKVIACIEHPNMTHSEAFESVVSDNDWNEIKELLGAGENDAQIIFWGPEDDIKTAIETIEERCQMAFEGIPNETRKSFEDGTTIFERVLPGADRMYPDTDSAPIPLANDYIEELGSNLPSDIIDRYHQLKEWGIAEDNYTYIFKNNLFPLIERIINELGVDPKFIGSFMGQRLKFVEGHVNPVDKFNYKIVYALFRYLKENKLDYQLAYNMIPHVYEHPKMDFDSVLEIINFKKISKESILSHIPFLKEKFEETAINPTKKNETDWIMGELTGVAVGNINLTELSKLVDQAI